MTHRNRQKTRRKKFIIEINQNHKNRKISKWKILIAETSSNNWKNSGQN